MLRKWLCALMALAVLTGCLAPAVSEDVVSGDVDRAVAAASDTGDTGLIAETADESVVGGEASLDGELYAETEGEGMPLRFSYVRPLLDDAPVYETRALKTPFALVRASGALLVTAVDEGFIRVAFDSDYGTLEGYMAPDATEPMDDAQTRAFMKAFARSGGTAAYEGDRNLPLDAPVSAFLKKPAAGGTPEREAPETTDKPGKQSGNGVVSADAQAPSLALSASKLTIGLKEKYTRLTATVLPEGAAATVTWASSDAKTVAVDKKTGAITGLKKGSATVTARTNTGLSAACRVTVKAAPTKVTLDKAKLTLAVGQSAALKAALPSGTGSALTFASSKKSVATVDAEGNVTALRPGVTKITVKTFNNRTATCALTVLAAPYEVLLPETLTIAKGECQKVTATVRGRKGAKSVTTFTYSAENDTGAIKIDADTGEIEGVKPGTAWIRVTTHNGVTTHLSGTRRVETVCAVTVEEGPTEVSLAASSVTIGVNQSFALKPVILGSDGGEIAGAKYTVTSSNAKKLSASAKGVVKGLAKGTYTVTVKTYNNVTATCKVKVVNAPAKVALSPKAPVIGVGQTERLKTTVTSGTAASFAYASSAPKVVSVDSLGNITGHKTGTATIKVTTHNKKTASVVVTVGKAPSFIVLNGDYELEFDALTNTYVPVYVNTLVKGRTLQITYVNEYQTYGNVVGYESLDPEVATVSSKGVVTAVGPGTAIILVTSSGGAVARMRITVPGKLPASIRFAVEEVTLRAGRSQTAPGLMGENISAADLADARYASDDTGVFTVDWSGEDACWTLTGVKAGTAVLTAVAAGATTSVAVTVTGAAEPEGIGFESSSVCMAVGETLTPRVLDDCGNAVQARLYSDDTGVVSVDESGALTAVAEGSARITAVFGALSAEMTVQVKAGDIQLTLDEDSLTLGVGQRHALRATVNGDVAPAGLAFASSDKSVATVSAKGVVIARGVGEARITVTAGSSSAECQVRVAPAPTRISVEPAAVSARLDEVGTQLSWSFGARNEIGTVSFTSADPRVADVDGEGYVTFKSSGATAITVLTNNGLTAVVPVTVLPKKTVSDTPTYRLFAAYMYFNTGYKGYIPFTRNNATSMAKVFGKSSVSGLTYSEKLMGNPSKTQLLSGINRFFEKTGDNDVSIVYLCSHGHMDANYRNYFMSLPGYEDDPANRNYSMTSTEIMDCVSRIQGSVVLIVDSCYSGAFLQDMTDRLGKEENRIAVMTAASNTRASYYKVADTSKSVDFFTYFLLMGLGYNEREGYWNADVKGTKGVYPGCMAADVNGNGIVTLGELSRYIAKTMATQLPGLKAKLGSQYWGVAEGFPVPRYYAGKLDDLVIYQPG